MPPSVLLPLSLFLLSLCNVPMELLRLHNPSRSRVFMSVSFGYQAVVNDA
ncbi:hypothetical protein CCACVL1_18191 [Corchorus capsularis]|uniref:Uncharacterized protein n=1 Tax=Corchorus capsularis TaxID=210143 RepID=A0A1R3HMB9_COCAP|nr:hypothetical protein CCACVL1_18191 [Corchorus capsularis]